MLASTLGLVLGVELNNRTVCIAYSMFVYFIQSNATVSSLGIALYRFLYIKVSPFLPVKPLFFIFFDCYKSLGTDCIEMYYDIHFPIARCVKIWLNFDSATKLARFRLG